MSRGSILLLLVLLVSSCSQRQALIQRAQDLNYKAYRYRYVNVDSVRCYADSVLATCDATNADAMVNLAYVAYQQMDFQQVDSLLAKVEQSSSNQVSLLCADVIRMKTYQRTGDGLRYFQAKSKAEKHLGRIKQELSSLSEYEKRKLIYAESEYHIISATYYFYQQQNDLAQQEMSEVMEMDALHSDTAQWVYCNYMIGSGGILQKATREEQVLSEFDYLMKTLVISRDKGYIYFEANAIQSLAQMLNEHGSLLQEQRLAPCRMLETGMDSLSQEQRPLALCEQAVTLFRQYDDLFQTACAWRTMGELYAAHADYQRAIDCYAEALHCVNIHHVRYYDNDTLLVADNNLDESTEIRWLRNPNVATVPEWIAAIRQKLSVAYAAIGEKTYSDYNHNAYLDLHDMMGQNRELQHRTEELEQQTYELFLYLAVALGMIFVVLLLFFVYRRRLSARSVMLQKELETLQNAEQTPEFLQSIVDEIEETEEEIVLSETKLRDNIKGNVEKRAKVSLVHDIVPFIDRIRGEVLRMEKTGKIAKERQEYIADLVERIELYNDVLTQWIKVQQGALSLRIKTIDLNIIFTILRNGHYAFDQQGVTLNVRETTARVKADESLTLFMINTLADNARKFTPEGGRVTVEAKECDNYVEISVSDTGCGLSEEDVDTLNHSKVYDPNKLGPQHREGKGFGFGLMNCRGIIEKYKKHAALFACCTFGVKSQVGQGSTFYFRLPRVAMALVMLFCSLGISAQTSAELYDSVYQCNLKGDYAEALVYAQEALNSIHPELLLVDSIANEGAEVNLFLQDDEELDFDLLAGIRNEAALAALALGELDIYNYNLHTYTHLHRLLNEDPKLPTYSKQLEQLQYNSRILLVIIFLSFVIGAFLIYRLVVSHHLRTHEDTEEQIRQKRQQMTDDRCRELQERKDNLARLRFEESRVYVENQVLDNCMSTIKHESMYYPARIRQLTESLQDDGIGQLHELTDYYHDVYMLLVAQADTQLERPCLKLSAMDSGALADVIQSEVRRIVKRRGEDCGLKVETSQCSLWCDALLVQTLCEQLLTYATSLTNDISVSLTPVEQNAEICVTMKNDTLTDEQLHELFYPSSGHTELLVVKQIIREHDACYGNPGLRLLAQRTDNEHVVIRLTLLLRK